MLNTNTLAESTQKDDVAFDVHDFCSRHFHFSDSDRNMDYTPRELHDLVNQAIEAFKKDQSLARMSPPCTIVGDIHGQFRDLHRILNSRRDRRGFELTTLSNTKFMFLGDFVDRGPQSIECICMVFSLKILYPSKYILLRGNHETKSINFAYGFKDELVSRLGATDGMELWEHFNEAFSWMPLAGLVGQRILCMHGGISPLLTSLNDIKTIQRPLVDVNENKLALDLLWSDPLDQTNINAVQQKSQFWKNAMRGLSVTFNEQAIKECTKKLNLQLIVRAHQVQENGFKFSADRRLVTIFSAPRYMNESNNRGAILKVYECGQISIVTLKPRPLEKIKLEKVDSTKFASIVDGESEKKKAQPTQPSSKSSL